MIIIFQALKCGCSWPSFKHTNFHLKCESVHDVCSVKLVNQKVNQCFSEKILFF